MRAWWRFLYSYSSSFIFLKKEEERDLDIARIVPSVFWLWHGFRYARIRSLAGAYAPALLGNFRKEWSEFYCKAS